MDLVLLLNTLKLKIMEKIIEFTPAFDKRNPDPKKNYGIHGVELRMVLKGELGATQFLLYTNWHLPHVTEELRSKMTPDNYFIFEPQPADKGYHSPKPTYEEQDTCSEDCKYLDGKPCYYGGSGLNAENTYNTLLEKGSEGVWKELEEYYISMFGELK
jgi:hypothetical protein